ncbi:MAG: efflux RND transporter permease subunit [Bacteroidales bacterium]|nr:efflux RND transporter permease subunit [Bacteroidales bacterium]
MSTGPKIGTFSSFTINIVFVLLIIIGLAVIPLLSLQLNINRYLPKMTISWYWSLAPSRVIEQEVTSVLEGVVSTIPGVEKITSETQNGSGYITISFDKDADLQAKRFEVASLMRETRHKLPPEVSYPIVRMNMPDNESGTDILIYEINGTASPAYIQKLTEEQIGPRVAVVEGIYDINVFGASPLEWELIYDYDKLSTLGIGSQEISQAISNYLKEEEIGSALDINRGGNDTRTYLTVTGHIPDEVNWSDIPVAKKHGRTIFLGEISEIRLKEQEARRYFRINGLNTIRMIISAEKGTNNIKVADAVKAEMLKVQKDLPPGYSTRIEYDTTVSLKKELLKIFYRTIASVILLLIFVLLISREIKYLAIITISLIANLAIAFIFYYVFKLELHLYSLAGITVSFGIIVDNTIVMTDHLRYHKNKKVFLAIMAATLTTVGALSVIFFLDDDSKLKLADFAGVIIINLLVSLGVALFFIPSLLDKIPLPVKRTARLVRRKRKTIWFSNIYLRYISFGLKYRKILIVLAILGFGLPVFLVPDKLPKKEDRYSYSREEPELTKFQEFYNKTIGARKFNQDVRPVIDKALGGSLRLFADKLKSSFGYYYRGSGDEVRTRLNVNIGLSQEGLTIEHLNDICKRVENMLAGYDEIENFTTRINSKESASMNITFDPDEENGIFPFILKIRIEDFMMGIGSYHVSVSGVGRAFSNNTRSDYISGSWTVTMKGYNYDQLMQYAEDLKVRLLQHPRIQEAYIMGSSQRYGMKKITRNRLQLDDYYLSINRSDLRYAKSELSKYSRSNNAWTQVYVNGFSAPLTIKTSQSEEYDYWTLLNLPVPTPEGVFVKLKDFSETKQDVTDSKIVREDQQYLVQVMYDFIGNSELGSIILKRNIDETKSILPIGYSADRSYYSYSWGEKKSNFYLIFLVILIIYFICAILLESLTQPIAVISLIPLSFIGVFLTFHIFKIRPDEGVLAAMLLLAGLVVNSALYIVNDYNNFRKEGRAVAKLRTYVKAYNAKVIPIALTILSTIIGLLPFLIAGKDERFWFSLAAGTIGGLVFSMIGLIFFLPVFMRLRLIAGRKEPDCRGGVTGCLKELTN